MKKLEEHLDEPVEPDTVKVHDPPSWVSPVIIVPMIR